MRQDERQNKRQNEIETMEERYQGRTPSQH